jgi:hypothetical protein
MFTVTMYKYIDLLIYIDKCGGYLNIWWPDQE